MAVVLGVPGEIMLFNGYKTFFDTVDVLAMGFNTYEQVPMFEGWHYGTRSFPAGLVQSEYEIAA